MSHVDSSAGTSKQRKRARRSPAVERDKMAALSQRAGEWKLPTSWGEN
jgi:ribosomal protein L32